MRGKGGKEGGKEEGRREGKEEGRKVGREGEKERRDNGVKEFGEGRGEKWRMSRGDSKRQIQTCMFSYILLYLETWGHQETGVHIA